MRPDRIQEILNQFTGHHVVVVGDIMLDRYIHGSVERLNPEAPVPILHAKKQIDMTGGAGNVAKNLVSLGATATLIGVVGEDDTAGELQVAARREGYTAHLISDATRPTTRKVRYLALSQQLLRVDWEETPDVSPAIEKQLVTAVKKTLTSSVDAVIVSDYAKGAVTTAIAEQLLTLTQKYDIPLAVDAKPSRISYFKGATLMAPNVKEAHEYIGLSHLVQGGIDVAKLAERLRETFSTDVFITLGAGGVYVCTNDGTRQHVPQEHAVTVADTSGAGDTSITAMILARLSGATPVEMAEIANAAGAVVVSKIGAVGVTPDEIRNMLLHRHEETTATYS